MLISIEKNFVFVFATKTASTSICTILGDSCDVSLSALPNLKHLGYKDVEKKFRPILDQMTDRAIIVSVVRSPLQRLFSLFRSHADEQFRDSEFLYTGNMDFAEFLSSWCVINLPQLRSTKNLCSNLNGDFVADYLINYDNLEDDLRNCVKHFDISIDALPHLNESYKDGEISTIDIETNLCSKLMKGDDVKLLPFTGRFLTTIEKIHISNLT